MEDWIYANTYEKNELLTKKMRENVEYAVRRLESHLEHNYPMNYVDQLAIQIIREYNDSKNKKTLKWEDLETEKLYRCKLNGTGYEVKFFSAILGGTGPWKVRLISKDSWVFIDERNKQFFDDLHLELISVE